MALNISGMKTKLFTLSFPLLSILLFFNSCKKDNNTTEWKLLHGISDPVSIAASFAINGKLYCLSTDWTQFSESRTIYEYDITTDSWIKKSAMPDKRFDFASACVNNRIYIIGGCTKLDGSHSKSVNEYNPSTDTWTIKKDMPADMGAGFGCTVLNNKIYVINLEAVVYDPSKDTWTEIKSLTYPRVFISPVVANNHILAISGFEEGNGDGSASNKIEIYDTAQNTWQTKLISSDYKDGFNILSLNDKVYFISGGTSTAVNKLREFDPATGVIMNKKGMNDIRCSFIPMVCNNKIYVAGGTTNSDGTSFTNKVEMYDPQTDLWTAIKDLSSPCLPDCAVTLENKIYVIWKNNLEVYDTKN